MSRLYDYDKKQWVNVAEEDTTRLVAEGTHGFEQGIDIPVKDAKGETFYIPSDRAHEAFRDGLSFGDNKAFSASANRMSEEVIAKHYDSPMNAMELP